MKGSEIFRVTLKVFPVDITNSTRRFHPFLFRDDLEKHNLYTTHAIIPVTARPMASSHADKSSPFGLQNLSVLSQQPI